MFLMRGQNLVGIRLGGVEPVTKASLQVWIAYTNSGDVAIMTGPCAPSVDAPVRARLNLAFEHVIEGGDASGP